LTIICFLFIRKGQYQ